MHQDEKTRFKILSFLLQYPDASLIADLKASSETIEAAFQGTDRERVGGLIRHLLENPMLTLQEEFSATFDLETENCLNLTYHLHGDEESRGTALADFAEAYRRAGLGMHSPELPDYLPMVLELVYLDASRDHLRLLTEHSPAIGTLAKRLESEESPYAGVFAVLAGMLGNPQEQEASEL
jgi:nitrate reductase delta subunit